MQLNRHLRAIESHQLASHTCFWIVLVSKEIHATRGGHANATQKGSAGM